MAQMKQEPSQRHSETANNPRPTGHWAWCSASQSNPTPPGADRRELPPPLLCVCSCLLVVDLQELHRYPELCLHRRQLPLPLLLLMLGCQVARHGFGTQVEERDQDGRDPSLPPSTTPIARLPGASARCMTRLPGMQTGQGQRHPREEAEGHQAGNVRLTCSSRLDVAEELPGDTWQHADVLRELEKVLSRSRRGAGGGANAQAAAAKGKAGRRRRGPSRVSTTSREGRRQAPPLPEPGAGGSAPPGALAC